MTAITASSADFAAKADDNAVSLKTWLAVIGSTLGAFMAVLNIQIVNASLADIQGAIGAGADDGGWISTAYLVAEIIVIPLTGWLMQVFSLRWYLLVNAAQAITEHGTITLRSGCADDKVWVSITDTGKGIPPELVSKIFDPFFTTKPVGKGTGLGLSIAYGIINKHGGSITVQSQPGQGTTFTIWLPIQGGASEDDLS